jgi:hypothetical protein
MRRISILVADIIAIPEMAQAAQIFMFKNCDWQI